MAVLGVSTRVGGRLGAAAECCLREHCLALCQSVLLSEAQYEYDPGEGKGFWPDAHDRMHSQHHTTP
eukprot:COSAG06_NODE_34081_length_480_cov_0.761155_1_plen_66_part_10